MRILFCNIAWMNYYKGIYPNVDEPSFGGSYVKETKDAHEKYNFYPYHYDDEQNNEEFCLGYFSTKSTNGVDANELHIEKIEGAKGEDDVIDDVLVVWCAKQADYDNRTVVVGWYKNAEVYRYYQEAIFPLENGEEDHQYYSVMAKAKDCVLLPAGERNRFTKWNVPRKGKGAAFGFGSANVWFASEESAREYVKKLVQTIESYEGESWLYKEL